MAARIDGKVAIVTGAGRGIGRAIADRFAHEGASVLVADIDAEVAEQASGAIGERAASFVCDVRRPDQVAAMFDAAEQAFGPPDIVVNNAGIGGVASIADQTVEDWDNMFAINVRGVFLGVQEAARRMIPRESGTVINIASAAGKIGRPFMSCYVATKHAVIGITRCAALELAPHGIRVNALCPGIVDTRLWREELNPALTKLEGLAGTTVWDQRVAGIPLGRHQTPEDVANGALLLASDDASYITGQSLSVDGGLVMQ